MKKHSVLLVEDEKWSRDLLIDYIKNHNELNLVDTAIDGKEALNLVKKKVYDLILLDINLPRLSGMSLLHKKNLKSKIIFTTVSRNFAVDAYEFGAIDYLLKPISEERFNKAIYRYLKKETFLPQKQENINEELQEQRFIKLREKYGLTYQEATICDYILWGYTREDIVAKLTISDITLKSHLKNIYAKTIDAENDMPDKKQGKMQKLTTFLYSL